MSKIAVVDYGMGNLHSVKRALEHVCDAKDEVYFARQAQDLERADKVVFPGQGAMGDCMKNLENSGLMEAVQKVALSKPLLGICVGQQMMLEHSEEGNTPCLGWFAGNVKKFSGPAFEGKNRLKVPHMGWNKVTQKPHPLWAGIDDGAFFYFVHSYFVHTDTSRSPDVVFGQTEYGLLFDSVIAKDNIFAVQFHPEKSANNGLVLLKNFVNWQI
ncbi:imidazole glycerol phosphate synthase subunit HisH [Basilea psittacipulmonis]|uniref:Imidazole glycerol phosphate synthase subunit HisH n=1 Tax=Basilea psittacipulmonis DSM 24701 TaxID=1072685 RepID=A0A077DEY2_9BURK|nr:imidazole glycerol phosphate synthase subunit HisH [Basilea psittacipulmonis]AIL33319.1 imidazole glycerol phosphate synthase [Basilea psittacipulmonis DSM 24701]